MGDTVDVDNIATDTVDMYKLEVSAFALLLYLPELGILLLVPSGLSLLGYLAHLSGQYRANLCDG